MPRAVIIAVGDLSLHPIKTLLEEHSISCEIVTVTNAEALKNIDDSSSVANVERPQPECLCVHTQNNVFKQAKAFSNIETLLVYSAPETYLAQKLASAEGDISIVKHMQQWKANLSEAIQISERNDGIKLSSLDDICQNPKHFIENAFGKEYEPSIKAPEPTLIEQAFLLIAAAELVDSDALYELYDDALSSGTLFGEFTVHLSPNADTLKANKNTLQELTDSLRDISDEVLRLQQQLDQSNEGYVLKSSEYENVQEELAKLKEEFFSVKQSDTEKLETLSALTKQKLEAEGRISDLEKELDSINEEAQFAQLQIEQLQEELELLVANREAYEKILDEREQLQRKVAQLELELSTEQKSEDLSQLQVAQLQEELEATFGVLDDFKRKEQTYLENAEALESLINTSDSIKQENASLTEQLSTLNNEMEKVVREKEGLNDEVSRFQNKFSKQNEAALNSNVDVERITTELELASLQVVQLQDEVESYYIAMQEMESSFNTGLSSTIMSTNAIQHRVFDKVSAKAISVTGQYITDGYQDIHLKLTSVAFPTGRYLDELEVKLVLISGLPGIEFRMQGGEGLFRAYEDATDEYGPYLRYMLTPEGELPETQRKVLERLNASERLLIMGCISVISQLLLNTDIASSVEVTPQTWREWRKAAIDLAEHIPTLPNWLSFDDVYLREEYRTEGYEHLWLTFTNILHGDVWRNSLDFKVSASAIGASNANEFSDFINIEFREMNDGTAPLVTWPPEETDEFGPKLNIAIDDVESLSDIALQDYQLIQHLVNNLASILEKLRIDGNDIVRGKEQWISAVQAVLNRVPAKPNEDLVSEQTGSTGELEGYSLIYEEVVSEGSYQHIVFSQPGNDTKIKLRAENINSETFDAETYLEFRDGTSEVVYNHSQFFGEDEYGPYVKIPLEKLEELNQVEDASEFKWACGIYSKLQESIHASNDIDELIKLLWKNILNQKSKK
ncbi:hypothetical protein GTH32_11000 [Alteromonas sp. 345S023]|uniref:Uncharacterized protein n=1 Tax=Alteromonas profundi TaxID=2696062 RepID=A0A7X5RLG6_9ALTE|nr:hypothetical protein [Alteromonas profundi]NDV91711.1 hypothetical protein [Alteromonas profundi]